MGIRNHLEWAEILEAHGLPSPEGMWPGNDGTRRLYLTWSNPDVMPLYGSWDGEVFKFHNRALTRDLDPEESMAKLKDWVERGKLMTAPRSQRYHSRWYHSRWYLDWKANQ